MADDSFTELHQKFKNTKVKKMGDDLVIKEVGMDQEALS